MVAGAYISPAASSCMARKPPTAIAIAAARPMNAPNFRSAPSGKSTVSQQMIRKQLTIHASWTFSSVGQAECARFVAERRIPLGTIFTHRFRLEEADAAYRLFDTQTTGKGVFLVDG